MCLRSEYLLYLIQTQLGDSSITVKQITAELRANRLLDTDRNQRSSKKLNKVRAPFIRLDELRSYKEGNPDALFSEDLSNIDAIAADLGLSLKSNI